MTSLDKFISDSARSYLQSVVYIDDKIYTRNGNPGEISLAGIPASPIPSFTDEEAAVDGETSAGTDDLIARDGERLASEGSRVSFPDYDAKMLMESFAERGIVCALYEPSEGALVDVNSNIFTLCQRADIVVLDWDLYKDDGAKVSELLSNLIKQSAEDNPHHVRLCSIYTNQQDLSRIARVLTASLRAAECTDVELVDDKLQLVSGATRISILGKPNVPGRPEDIESNYVVDERELADRLLRDFCEMHKGLLSGLALKGLSSIRKNTKRLLDKFSCDLDGAFLLHRALVKNDREALEELPELLADELSAILEDTLLIGFDYELVANDFIDSLKLTKPNDDKPFSEDAVRQQLRSGQVSNKTDDLERYNIIVGDAENSSSERLSLLFNIRTQYLANSLCLKFGTVVKHRTNAEDAWAYSICIMPICDSRNRSIPEEGSRSMCFPFWRLNILEGKWPKGKGKKLAAFVVEDNGRPVRLGVGGKIRDKLWLYDMKLGDDGWARPAPRAFKYGAVDPSHDLRWVAQLKPLHAQRIASHVGTEASRIGLTESEWLKILFDKS
jgi:hypothetical protein